MMARTEDGRKREQAVREAWETVRKSVKSGGSLVDDLLRERRAEVIREDKKSRHLRLDPLVRDPW